MQLGWFHRHDWQTLGTQMGRWYYDSPENKSLRYGEMYEFLVCRCGEFAIQMGGMRTTGDLSPEQRKWPRWRLRKWLEQFTPIGTPIDNQIVGGA